eukprot:jgi/Ulvmu1/7797/UM004_0026.1
MSRSGVRVLRMRGLPFSACNSDITEFFRDYNVEDVRIGMRQGKPTGEAFVRFSDERNCSDALAQLDKQMLGKRYIELFKAKDQDLDSSLPEVSISGKCNVIRMRGLPFSACIGDILEFFKNVPALDTENVYFVYDSSGRPSGEAYISFVSSDACTAAMKLHKNKMGARYIELFPSSSVDLQRAAKQRKLRLAKADGTSAKAPIPAKLADSKPTKPQCQGDAKQPAAEKSGQAGQGSIPPAAASLTPAPAAPPLRRTFASITAAPPLAHTVVVPAAAAAASAAASAPQPAPQAVAPAASSPVAAQSCNETFTMKLGALELNVQPNVRHGLSPSSAEAQPNTAAAAAAAVLESGDSLTGDCTASGMTSYSLSQPTHPESRHMKPVADLSALPGHDMLGSHRLPKNGLSHRSMGAAVVPPQAGGFVPDHLPGYHRHSVLAGTAGGYTQHQGSEYGTMASHAMLAGANHMQYPSANMSYPGGTHMASQQMRHPPAQPPAAGNNRQNVPPNVPPPMPHDEVWNMWGRSSVPGGIRDLWQSDMGMQDPKKAMPHSYDNVHQNGQHFSAYNMGPAQQDFGYGRNPPPYYPMDGRQGSRGGFREF